MTESNQEDSIIDPTVEEQFKESFSNVSYQDIGLNSAGSCQFSPETIVSSRKGPFDDVVTINKSFAEAVDVAQILLRFEQDSRYQEVLPLGETNDQDKPSKVTAKAESKQTLKNRRLFSSLDTREFFDGDIPKIPGEKIHAEFIIEATYLPYAGTFTATTIITNYRLILNPNTLLKESFRAKLRLDTFVIPLSLIEKVDKYNDWKNPAHSYLEIGVKDGRTLKLSFIMEEYSGYLKFCDLIEKLPNINTMMEFSAFRLFDHHHSQIDNTTCNWSVYNIDTDFKRQGIDIASKNCSDSEEFVFKKIKNKLDNEMICTTYPREFVVPSIMTQHELVQCSKFRSRRRLPVLVYFYKLNELGIFSTLWRSSQCQSGWLESRSPEDELMVRLIGNPMNPSSSDKDQQPQIDVHIYDARPYLNAIANKVNGKGYENTNNYRNAQIFFMEIPNIHVIRESYKKITTIIQNLDNEKYPSILEGSAWLSHISSILLAACTVVEKSLKKGVSALIHCSDGWDRTAQITSLVQLMIDPYYRTFEGFQVLIEKDWTSYGHQFRLRLGLMNKNEKDQKSPIFLQFLDCVHQLYSQFPYAFEFNIKFLSDLAYYAQTNLFGNFLCDCYEDLIAFEMHKKTLSIWNFLNSRQKIYASSLYDPSNLDLLAKKGEIIPNPSSHAVRFWREHFLYYHDEIYLNHFNEEEINSKWDYYDLSLAIKNHQIDELKQENIKLKKALSLLLHENQSIKHQFEGQVNNNDTTNRHQINSKNMSIIDTSLLLTNHKTSKNNSNDSLSVRENDFVVVEDDDEHTNASS